MSIGPFIRRLLGPGLFPLIGTAYRAVFVDLDEVVEHIPRPGPGALVLDVGGGDGAVLDRLLRRAPDAHGDLVDLAADPGWWIREDVRARVRLFPATSVADYAMATSEVPTLVLLCDVLHHVPAAARRSVLDGIRVALKGAGATLVIKDIEPGHWRASLSRWADRNITGDRNVVLVAAREARELVLASFPGAEIEVTALARRDAPNYMLLARIPPAAAEPDPR